MYVCMYTGSVSLNSYLPTYLPTDVIRPHPPPSASPPHPVGHHQALGRVQRRYLFLQLQVRDGQTDRVIQLHAYYYCKHWLISINNIHTYIHSLALIQLTCIAAVVNGVIGMLAQGIMSGILTGMSIRLSVCLSVCLSHIKAITTITAKLSSAHLSYTTSLPACIYTIPYSDDLDAAPVALDGHLCQLRHHEDGLVGPDPLYLLLPVRLRVPGLQRDGGQGIDWIAGMYVCMCVCGNLISLLCLHT